jgi:ABC-type amino acid transport substrate-binding protein/gamma-glutamylcyclotransferase (GGCT)/AIG2-like uncharacterized protein YtfP
MNAEERQQARGNIRSSLEDVFWLLSEYPKLALPLGVVVALFGLATIFKTLIDGFRWAYDAWQVRGVIGIGGAIALTSLVAVRLVSRAIAPRPVLKPFPPHCLSRNSIVRWEYTLGAARPVSYELQVKRLSTGDVFPIAVPERMHQIAIPDHITGPLEISVQALVAGKRTRPSRTIETEIYHDSVQRIRETGKLRVAVHTDPAEEIFCYFRDGRWQGLDTDFATLIASELAEDQEIGRPIDIEYSFFEWPAIIGAPNEHEIDMAIASITISAERSKKYGIYFSAPYAESKLGMIAYAHMFDGTPWSSVNLDTLNGKTVAAHKDTTALAFVETAVQDARHGGIQIHIAEDNDQLRELLRDNKVDAVVHDYYRAFTLLESGMAVYGLEQDVAMRADQYGIAFSRVNTPLLKKVDAIIRQHRLRIRTALDRRIDHRRRTIIAEDDAACATDLERPAIQPSTNLFVYGSLMFDEVWHRLVTLPFERKPARLSGYRRLKIKDQDYPAVVRGVGTVRGTVCLGLDEETMRRLDAFEAGCYRRVSGVVIDKTGTEILADFFAIKESHLHLVEDEPWDEGEFARDGLARFVGGYAGFRDRLGV